jgi:hypothetical protein
VTMSGQGGHSNSSTFGIETSFAIDSTNSPEDLYTRKGGLSGSSGTDFNWALSFHKALSEGYHYITLVAAVAGASTATYNGSASTALRDTLTCRAHGRV